MPNFSLGVVVLAAGASTRMGKPKLLLPWRNTTILGHVLQVWRDLQADQIAVVHAPGNVALRSELDSLLVPAKDQILNENFQEGMFSSVICAARWQGWNPDITHRAVVLGDQPHLPPGLLRNLIQFATENPESIVQPSFNERPRHPVMLPRTQFEALATSKAATLKSFLKSRIGEVRLFASDDPALEQDIDTPEDYEIARKLFGSK